MREKLFRGKRKDTGEWVYGDLFQNYDGRVFVGELVVSDYTGPCDDTYELGIGFREVYPNSVTQFTNLIDRNDSKLFEGDIIKVYKYKDYKTARCIGIILDNSSFLEDGYGRCMPQDTVTVELIGNVFDNQDLITDRSKRWIENYCDWPKGVYDIKWAY